ncbi:MAG: Metal-dependent hydrolase of the beta-lactamase superfamily III-like protein [Geobacteraceae bacterium]|nr:Metal-dependent hydrolase of the beta-lactamase superfamily III-like protein [Geobacteraceae bacterium]
MSTLMPFRTIEPSFFSGLLDDPVLLLNVRPTGRGILIDCGQVNHLAKRVMKSVDALFVTHAHMDHFMGIDSVIRHNHVSPRTLELFGPPGIADKMSAKFSGYDWNLTEQYWCSFRVHEVHRDTTATFLFPGPEGFPRRFVGEFPRRDKIIYRNDYLHVEADLCDHKIPVLVFKITERPSFLVDEDRIETAGLVRGPWLRQLKKRFCQGNPPAEPLKVLRLRNGKVEEEMVQDVETLYESIRKKRTPASIGYVSDIGFTEENLEKVVSLFQGVGLFVCECSFLTGDRDKARVSSHLCASDVNFLVDRLRPAFFLPMHLSKSYIHNCERIYDELVIPHGVTLLKLPKYLTPRPLLTHEAGRLGGCRPSRG